MSIEDRLRRAIDARTSSVDPSPDALGRITDKLSDQGTTMNLSSSRTRVIIGLAAAVVLLVAVVGGLMLPGDDDRTETGGSRDSTTTTDEPDTTTTDGPPEGPDRTTTTTASTTTPTTATPPTSGTSDPPASELTIEDQSQIVWPRPSSDVRFSTPEAAARSFARYYAGFRDPIVGAFQQADARSGEVPVRSVASGPETLVVVRLLGDGNWFVTSAYSETIQPTPGPPWEGSSLSCPLHLTGNAVAFEGHVSVRIDAYQPDGDRVELGNGYVTGSGIPPAGPFEGDVDCRIPDRGEGLEPYGVIRWWEPSAEDGSTLAIVAIPVPLHS